MNGLSKRQKLSVFQLLTFIQAAPLSCSLIVSKIGYACVKPGKVTSLRTRHLFCRYLTPYSVQCCRLLLRLAFAEKRMRLLSVVRLS